MSGVNCFHSLHLALNGDALCTNEIFYTAWMALHWIWVRKLERAEHSKALDISIARLLGHHLIWTCTQLRNTRQWRGIRDLYEYCIRALMVMMMQFSRWFLLLKSPSMKYGRISQKKWWNEIEEIQLNLYSSWSVCDSTALLANNGLWQYKYLKRHEAATNRK